VDKKNQALRSPFFFVRVYIVFFFAKGRGGGSQPSHQRRVVVRVVVVMMVARVNVCGVDLAGVVSNDLVWIVFGRGRRVDAEQLERLVQAKISVVRARRHDPFVFAGHFGSERVAADHVVPHAGVDPHDVSLCSVSRFFVKVGRDQRGRPVHDVHHLRHSDVRLGGDFSSVRNVHCGDLQGLAGSNHVNVVGVFQNKRFDGRDVGNRLHL